MFIINYRRYFFALSVLLVAGGAAAIFYYGLNLGVDFRGGAILAVEYQGPRPPAELWRPAAPDASNIQSLGERGLILRFATLLSDDEKNVLLARLAGAGRYPLTETRFNSIGPTLGRELARRGAIALALVAAIIILYIAFVFRHVSKSAGGVRSFKYGVIAVAALVHDLIIPTGVFAVLGYYRGVEIDALFLTALLTIMGLSVNDTIVVFDRIRENLASRPQADFAQTVGDSLRQTLVRSLNTSLAVILVLAALFFFGAASTRYFALALGLGMIVGTYSSIFLAAPLLVVWRRRGG